MDPNQNSHNINPWFNFMPNSQVPTNPNFPNNPNPNMINFQYPTLPFHPYPPINPCMDQGSSIGTSNKQCNEMEYNTPSDFTSKSQVPPFSIQVGSENMRSMKKEEEKKNHLKHNKDHVSP